MNQAVSGPKFVPKREELGLLPTDLMSGEKKTVEALSSLDSEWTVFIQPRVSLAQPDFVVLHPERGLWILEVKDWDPEFYRQKGTSGGRYVEVFNGEDWVSRKSPRLQLQSYLDVFRSRFFDQQASSDVQSVPRVILIAPRFTASQASALFGKFPTLTGDGLNGLATLLGEQEHRPVTDEQYDDLMNWLDEPEFVGDQRLPVPLTKQAIEVSENPRNVKVRRVRGPAGSGKSLALASRAVVLAGQGKSVLVVTYNITLAHYLSDLASRASRERGVRYWKNSVTLLHFHGVLKELYGQCGRPPLGDEQWEPAVIEFLTDVYESPGHDLPQFDAILVDEGQDFALLWWQFLRKCMLKPEGEMLLVADRTQNLYNQDDWTSGTISGGGFIGPWLQLVGSYRMPVDLIPIVREFGDLYLPEIDRDLPSVEQDHPALADAHEPTARKWVNTSPADVEQAAADEIEGLFRDHQDLSPSDIVLLADHRVGGDIVKELELRGIDVVSMFSSDADKERQRLKRAFWAGRPGIKCCTVHSFKGWEARAVVCVPPPMPEISLYIALTRVKSAPSRSAFVTVVNMHDSLRSFKQRFEREISAAEVPGLSGQGTLDL